MLTDTIVRIKISDRTMAVCGGVWWSRFRWRTTRAARTSTCTTSTVASWSGCCAGTTGKCISASSTPPLWRCTADQMMPRCAVLLGCARAVCGVACHWDVFMLSVVLHDADIDEMPCLWHCRRKILLSVALYDTENTVLSAPLHAQRLFDG